ncbi:ATP-binding protein [Actinoplanes couchii]|uniref:Sensor-like histidine kinase SenX3 n=1 Tax=Actinoplanes couchii TaxID=403638 RepID=A0ABQ3X8B8_9ACTN|nr:ATP-binding protein [Actinoplanes couchii]MDR6320234.1 signal transduction histidine kinase [Actinoplanes couchii]GID54751.1 hypothetical protein Aco03nite_031550 [Actinoplanes couchii]
MSLLRTVAFAVLYVAATIAGRMTIMDGTSLSLVWPAAGVAAVWFGAQWQSRTRWVDVAALSVITWTVNVATGASGILAAAFVVANLLQAGVFLVLIRRWRPHLWGAGGTEQLRSPRDLWALLGAGFIATTAGAAVGPTAVWLVTGHYSAAITAVWLVRNTASVLLIGAVGLCCGHAVSVYRARHGSLRGWWRQAATALRATPPERLFEYAGLALCSTVAYLAGFALTHGLPIAFALIALTVWAAMRLATPFVVLHDLAVGGIVVVFTLAGHGTFAAIESHAMRAFVAQLFVVMVAVVGLALALGRDERQALLIELASEKAALAVAHDEASRRAEMMQTIIESMADGLSVVDAGGRVVLRNPAAVRLLGGRLSPDDVVAPSGHYGICHLDGSPMADDESPYVRALTGEDIGMDVLVRNEGVPEGRILSVQATTIDHDRDGRAVVLLYTDVTADRRLREELTGFAGVVAHDLLNPLTTVEGWTTAAVETLAGSTDPAAVEAGEQLARVSRAAVRMRHLINDLLAYTTARDSAITEVEVDVHAIVADIVVARTDAAQASGGPVPRFRFDTLPWVRADPVLLRQLVDNLIANAIKYTAPGVTPLLEITSRIAGDRTEITIADNGIGIPAGQHDAIFGNFHRAHRSAGYSGTGLGLAICRRIVDRHGGTIAASDNPGGGSRFTFTLATADAGVPLRVSDGFQYA